MCVTNWAAVTVPATSAEPVAPYATTTAAMLKIQIPTIVRTLPAR